jgi:hypothetical protein
MTLDDFDETLFEPSSGNDDAQVTPVSTTTTTTTSTSTSDAPENNGSRHLNKRIINYEKQW